MISNTNALGANNMLDKIREIEKEFDDNIKMDWSAKIDNKRYVIPNVDRGLDNSVGSIATEGNTLEEAIEKAKEIAKSIKGYKIECPEDSLCEAQEEINKAKEFGVWIKE